MHLCESSRGRKVLSKLPHLPTGWLQKIQKFRPRGLGQVQFLHQQLALALDGRETCREPDRQGICRFLDLPAVLDLVTLFEGFPVHTYSAIHVGLDEHSASEVGVDQEGGVAFPKQMSRVLLVNRFQAIQLNFRVVFFFSHLLTRVLVVG